MLKRDPNTPVDTSKGYEISDVRVSYLLWGIAITFVLTIAAFIAMRLFQQGLEFTPSVSGTAQPTSAAIRYEQPPAPGPGLQVDLGGDLAALVEPQKRMLTSFGWLNEQEGQVHISIEAAMDRAVRNGLPSWSAPEPEAPAVDAGEVVDAPLAQ